MLISFINIVEQNVTKVFFLFMGEINDCWTRKNLETHTPTTVTLEVLYMKKQKNLKNSGIFKILSLKSILLKK